MSNVDMFSLKSLPRDLISGVVVFLVALPLCLGVALASNAPLFSGLLAGIVGGIVVGILSKSHTSVSGPAAGLTAVVAAQIASLGSFETFLMAVVIGGMIQVGFGVARAGFIAAFFPSSVIKGLLAAIGVIIVLKQIPHVLGHDADPEGEMSFVQPDDRNSLSEIVAILEDLNPSAAAIGIFSLAVLFLWDRFQPLKRSVVPAPLVVVMLGIGLGLLSQKLGGPWSIGKDQLVQVPVAESFTTLFGFLRWPDFSQWTNPAVYSAGLTIAIVASLESLLNLEAVDKLDPQQRVSPPSRELVAQGIGNIVVGLIGGIPVTSVIIRSSVNINAGARTKRSTIVHGLLILICVIFVPTALNLIPLSCLAAILLVTGIKLVSPQLVKQMWSEGRYQFLPFVLTVVAIVLTDLLVGILIGLAISVAFILNSNLRRPVRRMVEKHLDGNVLHIELANQVSFLNRAALIKAFQEVPVGGHVLLDAHTTDYIDPDILSLIREYKEWTGPARGVRVSVRGFRERYRLRDDIQFADYSTYELQQKLTSRQILQILKEGNDRFRTGQRLTRDLGRQIHATAHGQYPLAVVLSCIDSRSPAELVFDLGLGDIFSVRIAGNVTSGKVLGSMEYGCAVAGAKLILVMGHTQCGAVTAAVNLACSSASVAAATGCQHLESIVRDVQHSVDPSACAHLDQLSSAERADFINDVARQNVLRTVATILQQSRTILDLLDQGRVAVVGAMYDVATGKIDFLEDVNENPPPILGEHASEPVGARF